MPSIDQFRSEPIVETIGGDRTMVLNMGPQHPSTHGVLRLLLEIDGETIVRIKPDIGYLHTGIEKTCEAKFYQQVIPLTDRIDYLAPMTNNLAYVLAVEKLLGLEIPPRAMWIRLMLNELTRINSHLVWLGTHAMDIGAMTVFLLLPRARGNSENVRDGLGPAHDDLLLPGGRPFHGFAARLPGLHQEFCRLFSGPNRAILRPAHEQSDLARTHQGGRTHNKGRRRRAYAQRPYCSGQRSRLGSPPRQALCRIRQARIQGSGGDRRRR